MQMNRKIGIIVSIIFIISFFSVYMVQAKPKTQSTIEVYSEFLSFEHTSRSLVSVLYEPDSPKIVSAWILANDEIENADRFSIHSVWYDGKYVVDEGSTINTGELNGQNRGQLVLNKIPITYPIEIKLCRIGNDDGLDTDTLEVQWIIEG